MFWKFWAFFTLVIMGMLGLYTIFGILLDLYMKFYGQKVIATINYIQIIDKSNPDVRNDSLFKVKIKYSYQFNNMEYHSTCINSFWDLTRNHQAKIKQELNISDKKMPIYVCKFFPKIAMSHPLKFNKLFVTLYLWVGVILPVFIGYLLWNDLTVFDVIFGSFS